MKAGEFGWRQKGARGALVALAILGLSLLPLRAFCEPRLVNAARTACEHQTEHEGEKSVSCCASIDDSALVSSTVPGLAGVPSTTAFAVLLITALIPSGFVVQQPRLAGAPPPSRSYYARSARVLR